MPVRWLAIAVIFLIGFRVALDITQSNVIDVGYAGVIGADRIVDGSPLYGAFPADNASGDTYGPVAYLAYVPFEQALHWSGRWDDLPAAHAAAIAFDLLAVLLLFLIGRRMRGPELGVVLAYAWLTYPFTIYALMSNSNDTLVAVLVLAAVWAAGSAPARGALVALAGLTKFAPLALAPLFATHDGLRPRALALFVAGFAVAAALAFAPLLGHFDLRSFWDATIAFQAQRGSPFSIWGLYDPDVSWLSYAQRAVQVAARAARAGARLRPAAARPRRPRELQRGDHHRAAARRDALVLPLPAVVLRPRHDRAAGASAADPLVLEPEVGERRRRAHDLDAVAPDRARKLVRVRRGQHRWRHATAVVGHPRLDEELLDAARAERHEHPSAIGGDEVRVRRAARSEDEVAGVSLDALVADEDGHRAGDDVERLVLAVMDVQRGRGAARIVELQLGETPGRLLAAGLDGDSTAEPPDLREAVTRL